MARTLEESQQASSVSAVKLEVAILAHMHIATQQGIRIPVVCTEGGGRKFREAWEVAARNFLEEREAEGMQESSETAAADRSDIWKKFEEMEQQMCQICHGLHKGDSCPCPYDDGWQPLVASG